MSMGISVMLLGWLPIACVGILALRVLYVSEERLRRKKAKENVKGVHVEWQERKDVEDVANF